MDVHNGGVEPQKTLEKKSGFVLIFIAILVMILPNDPAPQFSPKDEDKMEDWRNKDWALNNYTCLNGHSITTVDVDEGTTPFHIECPRCKAMATSAGYPPARPFPAEFPDITHEWYRMNHNKAEMLCKAHKYHHENGGLFLRKRTKKVPIPNPHGPARKSPETT